jgi:hypothetical protein
MAREVGVNILPAQARAVLDGRKTQHRLLAHSRRAPVKRGQVVKLAPTFDARVQIRDVLWATAGKISGRDLKVEAFRNPVDVKRDFLLRYDGAWIRSQGRAIVRATWEADRASGRHGDWIEPDADLVYDVGLHHLEDDDIIARFQARWNDKGVWLVTLEPVASERYLLPAGRPAHTEHGYSTTAQDDLDAGEVVDPAVLRPEWAETAAARHKATQAGAKRDARLIAQRAEKAMLEHRLSGNSGPLEMLRRELDSLINDRREAA